MRTAALLSGLVLLSFFSTTARTESSSESGEEIVGLLRQGGFVLYLRHPETDPTQADTDTLHLDNVKAQRRLTPAGEAQAKALGEALRRLSIPIGEVLTSEYARAKDAARLAGFSQATTSRDLSEPQNVPPVEAKRRAAALRRLLSAAPAPGTHALLVGHRPNLQEAVGKEVGDLREGEIVIFRPLGAAGYEIVSRVPQVETWTQWVGLDAAP